VTLSGHRWLFRNFSLIDAGVGAGAGTAAVWSVRALARALTGQRMLASAAGATFFFLRFADRLGRRRDHAQGASGVYFFGRRAEIAIGPKAMIEFYTNYPTER